MLLLPGSCKKDSNNNPSGSITDTDGNIYTSITLGTQTWMVENLRTTKLSNGTPIPLVSDAAGWSALTTPGYCWYGNNETANKAAYGALYNWQAAVNACPTGWHLPSDEEWKTLEQSLGMNNTDANATGWRYSALVGSQLKESGALHWKISAGATNSSGFTALPGGDRDSDVGFVDLGNYGFYWSSSADVSSRAWYRRLNDDNGGVHRASSQQVTGYSVRCIKD